MIDKWFRALTDRFPGPRITVQVTITALVRRRMVRWRGSLRVRGPATVASVLRVAGRAAGSDLLGALAAGEQPVVLLSGRRLDLPADLGVPVSEGAHLSWLMPMTGG